MIFLFISCALQNQTTVPYAPVLMEHRAGRLLAVRVCFQSMRRAGGTLFLLCAFFWAFLSPAPAGAQAEDAGWRLTGQTGGTTKALCLTGDTLFIASGLRVLALDATDPSAIKVVGQSPLLPQFVESLTCDGDGRLFACCGTGGLAILDVSNLAAIRLLAVLDTRGYTEGVALLGQYAVLADGPQGVQVVDIADLSQPRIVSEAYPLAYAYQVALRDHVAYVAGGGSGLFTVDLRNPLHPVEQGLLPLDGFQYDVELINDRLYTAGAWGGISVLDLKDPLYPALIAQEKTDGWVMALSAGDNRLLVLDGASGVALYGIAELRPVKESICSLGGFMVDGATRGDTAFVLDEQNGFIALDFSNKAQPKALTRWTPLLDARRVTAADGACYVSGGASGLHVFDIANADAPVATFWYDCTPEGFVNKVVLDGGKAYAAVNNQTGPFMVFDAADPLRPSAQGWLRWGPDVPVAPDRSLVMGSGGFVYAPAEHHDYTIDVRDPQNPKVASALPSMGTGNADISGNLLATFGGQGIRFIDISDPANLQLIATFPLTTSGEAIRFIDPATLIVTADTGVWIVDVTDPSRPNRIATLTLPGSAMDITMDGTTAYVSNLGYGIHVLDLANPDRPKLVETIPTLGLAYDCCVQGDLLLVADSYAGLSVYRRGAASQTETSAAAALPEALFTSGFDIPAPAAPASVSAPQEKHTVVVTSAADAGPGSLRQALQTLQSDTTITFEPEVFPPSEPKPIHVSSALPPVAQRHVTIDASNAGVILDGSSLSSGHGLYIRGPYCTVMGLQIYHFPEMGIEVVGDHIRIGGDRSMGAGPVGQGNVLSGNGMYGVRISGWYSVVSGNLLGVDVTGTQAMPNFYGIFACADSFGATIGGVKPGEGNVISGNSFINCDSFGDHTRIIGNLIGVDITGTKAVNTDTFANLDLECGATGVTVGGSTPAERNIISGAQNGFFISDPNSYECAVVGNYIGTDITGQKAIPNGNGGGAWTSSHHRIGGTVPGEGNLISGNENSGIALNGYGAHDNIVLGNRFGFDAAGNPTLPNGMGVVANMGQRHATIGGYTAAEGNVLQGGSITMRISDPGIEAMLIMGNTIRNAKGLAIFLEAGTSDHFVQRNAFDSICDYNIRVDAGTGNQLRCNLFSGAKPAGLVMLLEHAAGDLSAPVLTKSTGSCVQGRTVPYGLVEVYRFENKQALSLGFACADADGVFDFVSAEPLKGQKVIALVTDLHGNTSAFSKALKVR